MEVYDKLNSAIDSCQKLLIGIGEEWDSKKVPEIEGEYEKLSRFVEGHDYFIITTVTDGLIRKFFPDGSRIVAPCGNATWRQCSKACTKDIWEPGELPDDICPHCGAPLTGNTIASDSYIEEGYLPQWNAYTRWLAGTLNRDLAILELGVGFGTPTVIRWPFEKTVSVNEKAHLYRIHGSLPQMSADVKDRADSVLMNSVEFFRKL